MKTAGGIIAGLFALGCITGALAREHQPKRTAFAGSPLSGSAAVSTAPALKLLDAAEVALSLRLYAEAKRKYEAALQEIHRGYRDQRALCRIKLGLAEVSLKYLEDADATLKMLAACQALCRNTFGNHAPEMATLQLLQSEAYLAKKNLSKAFESAEQSLAINSQRDPEGYETGVCLALMARIEHARGLNKEATELSVRALRILEAKPGVDMLDYARALYGYGLARLSAGDESTAAAAIEKSRALLDAAVSLNKTPDRKGIVRFEWSDGVPECRQIYDATYPLKYMLIDKLRVAVALVRSDKHLAAIVSLANCSAEPMKVAVGPVILEKTTPGETTKMFFCDPGLIDMPLEEECVSNLTWRKRWLCHIQKTHRIPGYLKSGVLDPDNFYGNNLFGTYGSWDGSLKNSPPVVTREQFFFENEKSLSYNEVERFMARSTGGYRPALIEPGDARTGVVFFLRQRYDTARVRVMVGNAVVDFPFQSVTGQ